ncbi:HlyD family type I secretion periplasmic adaptor subunit [Sphingomonas morindae]|uniref:Membrane fusion protein (MFP) family protein n=1 Tax=Sphingomonas morindae TaxID=1541170 RepID=A0ABY4X7F8_9SPHN|nr:HlyD family type I secretion periplasmic adaptor subunit [Sphingomonas morindae]USI72799.1 HlyD family type I secretion periplasmic adaptor subunit [Sphingomonas morindae]
MRLTDPALRARQRRARDVRLDREFLAPAQEILASPASPLGHVVAGAICALFAIALLIAALTHIDIYAVASGRIQPLGRSKVIQPLDTGRVVAVHVANGSAVRRGQLLVELDRTEPSANVVAARDQLAALTAEIARRRIEIAAVAAGRPTPIPRLPAAGLDPAHRADQQAVLAGDLATLAATLAGLRARIAENDAQQRAATLAAGASHGVIGTLRQRVAMRQSLLAQGWESRANVMDASEDLLKEQSVLAQAQGALLQSRAARGTLESQIRETTAKFIDDDVQALSTAREKQAQVAQQLVKAAASERHTRIVAPLDGTVQELDVTTLGQVVSTGQQLMTVVPRHAPLEIEAMVANQDIGFVAVGQRAVIKLDAFPFTRYGTVAGEVTRVSRDAVASSEAVQETDATAQPIPAHAAAASPDPKTRNLVFPVTVRLDTDSIAVDGRPVPLSAGLSATVEIRTGARRVLEYILSPLFEVFANAGHER